MQFATKPRLADQMIEAALDAGITASWVTGDETYGQDPQLHAAPQGARHRLCPGRRLLDTGENQPRPHSRPRRRPRCRTERAEDGRPGSLTEGVNTRTKRITRRCTAGPGSPCSAIAFSSADHHTALPPITGQSLWLDRPRNRNT
ncbi:transposase [Streptomyces sp. CoH27]|uniref:transposase n=1 Tax=Streptomyces sp. CoH27 TaxID=2875763 RepID=UPI0035A8C64D